MQLSNYCKRTRISNAVAAGTTTVTCTIIDMLGFESIKVTALLNALTATQVTKLQLQGGQQANGSDAANIPGAVTPQALDADSNKMLSVEVNRPSINGLRVRYITALVLRGTANAAIDAVIADQFLPKNAPQLDDATTTSQQVVSQGG